MANFDKCFKHTLLYEGGYADLTDDPGGKTKYGITEKVARAHSYKGSMQDLTLDRAKEIYKKDYYLSQKLDQINSLEISMELFDTGVNCGIGTSGKIFQRSINLLTGSSLKVDGKIGQKTINEYKKIQGSWIPALLKVLNGEQYLYYKSIILLKPRMRKFFRSWLRRV